MPIGLEQFEIDKAEPTKLMQNANFVKDDIFYERCRGGCVKKGEYPDMIFVTSITSSACVQFSPLG